MLAPDMWANYHKLLTHDPKTLGSSPATADTRRETMGMFLKFWKWLMISKVGEEAQNNNFESF